MTINLELDRDEAVALRNRLMQEIINPQDTALLEAVRGDIVAILDSAITCEDEAAYDRQQERLMETGGVDGSRERGALQDAG